MCGVNLITYYAARSYLPDEYLGMDDVKSRILAAAIGMMQPLGGLLAFFTNDRLGRRLLMTWSAGAMTTSMAMLAGKTSPKAQGNTAALVVAVIALFCFHFIFSVGYSRLFFLYAAELAPLQARATVSSFSIATVWVFNFLLAEVTPIGFNTIHNKYYIVFAGRSLEEIDEIFAHSKNIFDPPGVERRMQKTLRVSNLVNRPCSDSCGEDNKYVKEEVKA
ncbi:uncharacterized protein N7498_000345 [Penicillium cinerascens]|uniref:Major facilitator superfamily (MFS) profile domain-containing protein n=1 Tax=Penicillium cinerascens TaxID=70096 RepID=A0A9W9NE78_9EURO|nr:uncharacterized protein N7498_000345 [Penicillium cinerascens]KAJ5218246.1 hypothetical protein N7498_000345 [Penicillium cinerascens]